MLRAEGLHAGYGRGTVLAGIDLEVSPGEIVVLLGANGAGKTTTLRALSGLVGLESGRLTVDDADLTGATTERLAAAGVGHVPEGRGTFATLTVRENLLMGLYPRRRSRPDRTAELGRVSALFPALAGRMDQRAGTLSGGEQQMLAIGRALVSHPRYLLVDEPSHGLAPRIVAEVFDLLEGLRGDGLGVLVVEQQAARALRSADRAYVLERGRIAASGEPSEIGGDRERLADAYLGVGS